MAPKRKKRAAGKPKTAEPELPPELQVSMGSVGVAFVTVVFNIDWICCNNCLLYIYILYIYYFCLVFSSPSSQATQVLFGALDMCESSPRVSPSFGVNRWLAAGAGDH